jgi:hypothetical protein
MNGLLQLRTPKTISNIRGEEVKGPSYMETPKPLPVAVPETTEVSA